MKFIGIDAALAIAISVLYASHKAGVRSLAKYRLRAAKHKPDRTLDAPLLDDRIDADSLGEAVEKAKNYLIDRFLDNTDYAWLTDSSGKTVWDQEV